MWTAHMCTFLVLIKTELESSLEKGAVLSQVSSLFKALKNQVEVAGMLEQLISVSKFTLQGAWI